MKTQKVLITETASSVSILLEQGYSVVSVTAQHVSTGGGGHLYGKFLVVLEK